MKKDKSAISDFTAQHDKLMKGYVTGKIPCPFKVKFTLADGSEITDVRSLAFMCQIAEAVANQKNPRGFLRRDARGRLAYRKLKLTKL